MAISGTTVLVPYHVVKSLQSLFENLQPGDGWNLGAQSSSELQWLNLKIGHQDSSPTNGHQGDMLYYWLIL